MQPPDPTPSPLTRKRYSLDWAAPYIQPRICITCGEALPDWRWPQCRRCYLLARLSTAQTYLERERLLNRLEQLKTRRDSTTTTTT